MNLLNFQFNFNSTFMKKIVLSILITLPSLVLAQLYPMGIPDGVDQNYESMPLKAPLTRGYYEEAPPSSSLKRYAPTPASQGQYGTCTGWAVAYSARTIIEAKRRGWNDKYTITQNAFSATFQYRQASDAYNCWGAFTSDVVQSLKSVGSLPKKDFYVSSGTNLCPGIPLAASNLTKARQHKIEEYATLWSYQYGYDYGKIGKVKSSLAEGNPVVISMICPASFHSIGSSGLWTPTESPDDDTSGQKHGRHALCVVGYDNNKFGGAFEIQNSWGTSWGNDGYCWVKYRDFASFVYQAYEVVQFPTPTPQEPYLAGSLRLYDLDDKKNLGVRLADRSRNWNVAGGGNHTYRIVPNLVSDSEMRMYLTSEQAAYVYMLGTGAVDRSVTTLFPVDNISPALNYTNSEIALPSEDHYFKMDNTTGKNYIIIIFSKSKLSIDNLKNKVATGSGSLGQKLRTALSGMLIPSNHIDFETNEIKFKAEQNSSGKKAFAMIIEFNQVD